MPKHGMSLSNNGSESQAARREQRRSGTEATNDYDWVCRNDDDG
jgi:hypothetical protein